MQVGTYIRTTRTSRTSKKKNVSAYRRPTAWNYINYEPSNFKLYQILLLFLCRYTYSHYISSIHLNIWTVQHYCNGKIPIPSGKSLYVCFLCGIYLYSHKYQIPVRSPVLEASIPDTIIIKLLFWKSEIQRKLATHFLELNIRCCLRPFYNICESNLQKYFTLYKEYKL